MRWRAKSRDNLIRLWDACQTPDFRKTSLDEHLRLTRTLFEYLTEADRRIPEDWMAGQFKGVDRTDGDIDALAGRLANVRTLAYVANRTDWLRDPAHWQGQTRALEDRLSDTLHEKLMQRFIDRRTSAILRGLHVRNEVLAGVGEDGAVTVEGHYVGHLRGAHFEAAQGATALEDKALRAAAQRAVSPEVGRRLGALAAEPDEAFALQPDGMVLWRGEAAGQLCRRRIPSRPGCGCSASWGPRRRASARRGGWRPSSPPRPGRRLGPLRRLETAIAEGKLKGLARGVGYRLAEAGGLVDRGSVDHDLRALSQAERRELRTLGVRIGAFSVFMPGLLSAKARSFLAAFATDGWRPPADALSPLPHPAPLPRALAAHGLRAVGRHAVPVEALERLDAILRAAPRRDGGAVLAEEALAPLGWSPAEGREILRGLGFAPAGKAAAGEPVAWRARRAHGAAAAPEKPPAHSPFAALAALKPEAGGAAAQAAAAPAQGRSALSEAAETCRIDVWLWRARFFRTRALAARFVEEGRVRLTRADTETRLDKASRNVRAGDELVFAIGGRLFALRIEACGERRGPASEARGLYSMLDAAGAGKPQRTPGVDRPTHRVPGETPCRAN